MPKTLKAIGSLTSMRYTTVSKDKSITHSTENLLNVDQLVA
jgi:hypothetical protein